MDEVWRMSRRKQTKPLRLNEDEPQALGKSNFEKTVIFTCFLNYVSKNVIFSTQRLIAIASSMKTDII